MSIKSVMPSNHLILCYPFSSPSIRVFPNESALHIRWPKYRSFSFSISPSIEYSGLISFKTDSLISLLSLLKMNDTLKKNWDGRNHDIVAPFVCCKWLEDKDYITKRRWLWTSFSKLGSARFSVWVLNLALSTGKSGVESDKDSKVESAAVAAAAAGEGWGVLVS